MTICQTGRTNGLLFPQCFHRLSAREAVLLLALAALGVAGNYPSVSLFFGVDFLFGSIPALVAVRLRQACDGGYRRGSWVDQGLRQDGHERPARALVVHGADGDHRTQRARRRAGLGRALWPDLLRGRQHSRGAAVGRGTLRPSRRRPGERSRI